MAEKSTSRVIAVAVILFVLSVLVYLLFFGTYSEEQCIPLVLREVERVEKEYGMKIDPHLALAVIKRESKFNPYARGRAGERGLMQIMPETASQISGELEVKDYDLFDRATNIRFGVYWLSRMHMYEGVDNPWAYRLAEYNAGRARVRQWMEKSGDPKKAEQFIKAIGIQSTRAYVRDVLLSADEYRRAGVFEGYGISR